MGLGPGWSSGGGSGTASGDVSVGVDTSYDVGYACGGMPHAERACGVAWVMSLMPPRALGRVGRTPSRLVVAQPAPTTSGDVSVGADTS